VGGLLLLSVLALLVGAVTGKVRARSCCNLPAADDLRLRAGEVRGGAGPEVRASQGPLGEPPA
jgi:hypothetical protein